MEDWVSLERYTASLCYGSCRKERPETKMVSNVFLNKIEITYDIHEGLYFLSYKNHHQLLSASRVFLFRLTMTRTRLIHCSNLCSSCIGPDSFALLSIPGFLPTLRLFVVFSFTIGAKDLFPTAVFIQRAGSRSITSPRLSRSRWCGISTRWQGWFGLTIEVGTELLRKSNQIMLYFWHTWLFADFLLHLLVQPCKEEHNFHLSRIVGFIPNLCFEGIALSKKCIFRLIGRFFGLQPIKPWSMDPMGAIS